MKHHQRSFSLIEMLIVISVVFLLMSLLSPSLKNLLKQTHNLKCKSKIGNIYRSMMLYASDENDHFTPLVKPKPRYHISREKLTWDDYLAPYDGRENASRAWLNGWGHFNKRGPVPEWDQYVCPSNPLDRVRPVFNDNALGIRRDYEVTRGQEFAGSNGLKNLVGIASDGDWSAKTTEVHLPNSTIILTERVGPRFMGYPFHAGMANPSAHQVVNDGTYLHDVDHYNYLFADGHIEYMYYLESVTSGDGSSLNIRESAWNYERN